MKQVSRKNVGRGQGWLLFFYSIPSKPVSNRMKIWRKLSKAGTVLLKGAVYILPMSEEHHEFFQWLVSEVSSMGGEAAFTRVEAVDSIKDEEIKALFNVRQEGEYQAVGRSLDDIETRANSIRKGSKIQNGQGLLAQLVKVRKSYEETLKTDFFFSTAGAALRARIDALDAGIKGLTGTTAKAKPAVVSSRKTEEYQGRIWVSRKRPFVDRMASAWLIRRFIDRNAAFMLVDEKDLAAAGQAHVTFDVSGGAFTHLGDLCTFEVLMKSFGLRDKAVRRIAEVVHELDIKDDKYRNPETRGLEDILSGLRKSVKDDMKLLEKGMAVFEMLYVSKS
ncbi:MAG: chromate resistance protein [Nitrospirae bacterium]|nr:chromate resistance protein [Nitrospirota bacterium]